jgi:hypothetical protein
MSCDTGNVHMCVQYCFGDRAYAWGPRPQVSLALLLDASLGKPSLLTGHLPPVNILCHLPHYPFLKTVSWLVGGKQYARLSGSYKTRFARVRKVKQRSCLACNRQVSLALLDARLVKPSLLSGHLLPPVDLCHLPHCPFLKTVSWLVGGKQYAHISGPYKT